MRVAAALLVLLLACSRPEAAQRDQQAAAAATVIASAKVPPISTLAPAATFDRQYIDMLVPHHEATIEMARIALGRAQREEILLLADEIIKATTADVVELRGLRKGWFGTSDTPPIDQTPMLLEPGSPVAVGTQFTVDLSATVEALRIAPEPFDAAFIEAMLPHQQRAIDTSLMALRYVRQQELLDLAGEVVASHSRFVRVLTELKN